MPRYTEKTFLLVEDNENDAWFVQREFGSQPQLQLKWVKSGAEALDYLHGKGSFHDRRQHPIPDVILLDLKMPGLNGFDVLEWLRNGAPYKLGLIPVVVLSSSDEPRDVERAYDLGANFYMTKPVQWKLFRERIRLIGILWTEHAETPPRHGSAA